MIDLHCHLDLIPNILEKIKDVSVKNAFTLAVTTSPRAWRATSKVFSGYLNIYTALGLHPEVAGEKFPELPMFISSIQNSPFIGEVGLDKGKLGIKTFDIQASIFKTIIEECDKCGGRILSVHSRFAVKDVLKLIEKYSCNNSIILHWFGGTLKEYEWAVSLGCYFSINPLMAEDPKYFHRISLIPLQHIFPESDAPFSWEASKRRLMPWDTDIVAELLEKRNFGENFKNIFYDNLSQLLQKHLCTSDIRITIG